MQIQIKKQIEQFANLIQGGIDSWVKAGEILIDLKSQDSAIFEKITNLYPHITESALNLFYRIGAKEIYPYVLINRCPAADRLLTMPYDRQVEYFNKPMTVVVRDGSKLTPKPKRIREITAPEAERLFNGTSVRTAKEQIDLINKEDKETEKIRRAPVWEVQGDSLIVRRPTTLSRALLETILDQMPKPTAEEIQSAMQSNQLPKP